jgi:hypothetical protein
MAQWINMSQVSKLTPSRRVIQLKDTERVACTLEDQYFYARDAWQDEK